MAGETTPSALVGFLKPIFGKLQILVPEDCPLQDRFKFEQGTLLGDSYQEPVQTKVPWGLTAVGSDGAVVALNAAINSTTENAKITPYMQVLRDQVSYGLIDRSENEKGAFMKSTEYVARGLGAQLRRIVEFHMLHGQEGLFTVNGAVAGQVMTVSDASFAPGLLNFLEGAKIDVYQSDLSTLRQGGLVVSAVDLAAKTVTVTGTVTGITTNDVAFLYGYNSSGTFKEFAGFGAQLNLTSGSTGAAFGVSKANNLWKSSKMTSAGNFGASLILQAMEKASNRGYRGRLVGVMAPKAFRYLNQANIAQQIFNDSNGKAMASSGSGKLEFTQDNITFEPMSHGMQKEGQIYCLPEPHVRRIGSKDITFAKPGEDGQEKYWDMVPGYTAIELQARTDQATFIEKPAFGVIISGITYA